MIIKLAQINRLFVLLLCFLPFFASADKLRFVAESLPPFHFLDENNKPTGALVEVIQALITSAHLDASIEFLPFARSYHLAQQQANAFMFSLLKTPHRESQFKWVGQSYKSEAFLVGLKSRSDINISNLEEAKNYVVGTIRGYHADAFLKKAGFSTDKNLSLSVKYDRMWPMLFKQRIDLVLTNYIALDREISSVGLDPKAIKKYIAINHFPNQLYIATSPTTSDDIVLVLRQALEKLKQSGQYQTIIDKWGL